MPGGAHAYRALPRPATGRATYEVAGWYSA